MHLWYAMTQGCRSAFQQACIVFRLNWFAIHGHSIGDLDCGTLALQKYLCVLYIYIYACVIFAVDKCYLFGFVTYCISDKEILFSFPWSRPTEMKQAKPPGWWMLYMMICDAHISNSHENSTWIHTLIETGSKHRLQIPDATCRYDFWYCCSLLIEFDSMCRFMQVL